MHPITQHGGYGAPTDLDSLKLAAANLAADLEMVATEASGDIYDAVGTSREYAAHRKLVYMVGAPLVIYVGLTNKKHKGLGLLSAAVGAYVGMKNYQESKDSEAAELGGYGSTISHCVGVQTNRRCPRGYRKRRVTGRYGRTRVSCCRSR